MRPRGGLVVVAAGCLWALSSQPVWCDPLPLRPTSTGINGNVYTVFQANTPLKRPGGDTRHVTPFYQYLDVSAVDPKHGLSLNTFLRGREVANGEEATFDVYNAYVDYRALENRLQVRAGRQIVTEGTNFTLLDGALVRGRPLDGIEVVAYGGYQHNDLQPRPEEPDDSFGLFGARVKSSRYLGALMSLGYEGTTPNDNSPRHLLHFAFNRVVPYTDFADFYSRLELDIAEGNPAFFNSGVGLSLAKPLYVNLEYDTYKPDKDRDAFLQDRIFDVFSVSRLHEARIGLTYRARSYLDVSTSYSFATYDRLEGESSHGNIWKAGLVWNFWRQLGLRAFNGLYLIEGRGRDQVIGANSGLSQEVLRGLELHALFAFANFHTITGQGGNAYSYIAGAQYLLVRNVSLLAEVELNRNPDFENDVRGNFGLSYYFSRS